MQRSIAGHLCQPPSTLLLCIPYVLYMFLGVVFECACLCAHVYACVCECVSVILWKLS